MIVGGQTEARAQLSSTIIDYHEPFDQGFKLSCTRALFLVTGKFYSVAQALTKAPRQPASLKCNFFIGWKNDVI